MGVGHLRAGRRVCRHREGLHLHRARGQRSAGDAGLRRLAEDDCAGSTGAIHFRRRPVLETALMAALTAGEVVNRIKAVMAVQGVSWSDASTRDRFKFGGPDTVVTGIATTFMGTFEAITRASERGLNLIIPHEDTYWNDADNTVIAEADTLVYKTKVDFMTKNNIAIFRIHDHMHRQRPDFTFSGTAREVGLDPATETAPNSHRFVIPETTLGELAARVKKIRGDDAIRIVGDPVAKVSRIAVGAGMATPAVNVAA